METGSGTVCESQGDQGTPPPTDWLSDVKGFQREVPVGALDVGGIMCRVQFIQLIVGVLFPILSLLNRIPLKYYLCIFPVPIIYIYL